MYVATIPNRNSRPAILLREGYRENGKVKNRTLKNLSNWPAERVELLRAALRGDGLAPAGEAWRSRGRYRTAMCWRRSARHGPSSSMRCCRGGRSAAISWRWR